MQCSELMTLRESYTTKQDWEEATAQRRDWKEAIETGNGLRLAQAIALGRKAQSTPQRNRPKPHSGEPPCVTVTLAPALSLSHSLNRCELLPSLHMLSHSHLLSQMITSLSNLPHKLG